jgi:hypothetical protein
MRSGKSRCASGNLQTNREIAADSHFVESS